MFLLTVLFMELEREIKAPYSAWEAAALPLSYTLFINNIINFLNLFN